MPQIAIRISEQELALLDKSVAEGRFESRAAAVRAGLEALEREGRNQLIAEAYREGYEKAPSDDWFAEENAGLLDQRLSAARGERDRNPQK